MKTSLCLTAILVAAQAAYGAKQGDFYHEDRNAPMESTGHISPLADKLPFAYYPSLNRMEVAMKLPDKPRQTARVIIKNHATGQQVAEGKVPLNDAGEGQSLFDVPDFPDGEYAIDYHIGDQIIPATQTFKRIHFPFEGTTLGITHEVFPPFTPVKVSGRKVSIVGRTYTLNGLGLFDKVETLGRDILARPMRLVMLDAAGKEVAWRRTDVKGKVLFDDEAQFDTRAEGGGVTVASTVTVQEDGAARIRLTLAPKDGKPVDVAHLKIEIALKDAEAPLFHYVADNSMRFNYGGYLPRPEKDETVDWYLEPWDGWVTIRNRIIPSPGATDATPLWHTFNNKVWRDSGSPDYRDFVPYIWLGAEARGLAFFMESEKDCVLQDEKNPAQWAHHHLRQSTNAPLQRVYRKGGAVVLEADLFQRTVTLDAPHTFEFGLMASPGKPLDPEYRTRRIAWGLGPVVCWGGWLCASKYPTLRSWDVVDRIQSIRKARRFTDDDRAWLAQKAQDVAARWPGRQVHDNWDWLKSVTYFSERADDDTNPWYGSGGIYFEEHNSDVTDEEWHVFQDEWGNAEFARFQPKPPNWGVGVPSYQDFSLHTANEWMTRGVSLYFDNAFPKRAYTERFGCAWRHPSDGRLLYGTTLWEHRAYYRRIFKLMSHLNRQGQAYPLDFTLHMTNTQTLPLNTWATVTMDFEQCALEGNPADDPAETPAAAKRKDGTPRGFQYPWPADYLRAVTLGQQTGTRALGLFFLTGYERHEDDSITQLIALREWGMRCVHDIAVHDIQTWQKYYARARAYDTILRDFGYGDYTRVRHHTYWTEKPFLKTSAPDVKWLALETLNPPRGDHKGMVLLQSYAKQKDTPITLTIPNAKTLTDTETGETIPLTNGTFTLTLQDIYATRMLYWK